MTILIAIALILAGGIVFAVIAAIIEGRRGVDRAQRRNR